ncbi:PEP-CTERM sorting domain-containing protein [Roseateles saccharophilus]|uniref:Putative secreted protein n=1 Tax=Roseateles saccharophilus TaxID=304 RepID=A0A4R3VEH4_ROSSA|nr:PEP-CTERM sorting domain-containing protein [Roseateles saccharophilus]MDG0832282.1 PEP-CTERM sorting domain-containing protein [Roseateles saccharophilus]TCV02343.1 putative secreted protein [Roseateles saccharophilus]
MQALLRTAAAAAALTLAAGAHAVVAAPFYESASFVDESVANGDYYIDATRFLGAGFTVSQAEAVSAIGGNFTQYGDGNNIFGAIVKLDGNGGLQGQLSANVVAEAVFTPTGGDQSVALNTVLQPGQYAVVFGSGLFGTTGSSGLVAGQAAIGSPSFLQYDGSGVSAFTGDTLRVTVNAVSAVPEPASALLFATGAMALGLLRRRRA